MVSRGEIWWVDFGQPVGSEPGLARPAVIVSAEQFNKSSLATVTVVPLYSNLRQSMHPGNVTLYASDTGLNRDSVANVSQIVTVDRQELEQLLGAVPPSVMRQVDDGLRLALEL